MNIFLKSLILENFRNFHNFEVNVNNKPVVIIGENGSGKTSILEAISLLYPGKGLRSAKLADICKTSADYCKIQALLFSKLGEVEITSEFKSGSSKRTSKFNGSKILNNELSRFTSIAWLTPQMEGIFLSGTSDRRKFFDRIVFNFNPKHAELVSQYDYYMQERNKILSGNFIDTNWLTAIEEKMSNLSVTIAYNRINILQLMQQSINELDNEFPKADLFIDGVVEKKTLDGSGEIADFVQKELYKARDKDRLIGRASFGVHKSDVIVKHKKKNTLAKLCSTGEQKALLIAIILAEINHAIKLSKAAPILLLDEVFVHLDDTRKNYLSEFFIDANLQFWVTATDLNGIRNFADNAQIIELNKM